ncbi:hypothetical protein LCGC14_0165050 [marine sediment metagenome]|uniref:Uncharacterized protein n=1 Tax=marine sediment metagenome TaxID=412755 RepID=A0A0F9XCZ9_9ZZZZ
MPKLRFVGVGSAFAGAGLGQSNMVIEAESGKRLLIDCGQRSQDMLHEQYGDSDDPSGLSYIDGVYITHLHADHIGGLEWLALCTYFNPTLGKPKLFCIEGLMHELWDSSLKGGLSTIQGGEATLTTFFDCQPLKINDSFVWEDVLLTPVQTVHVVSGYRIMHCYGLMIQKYKKGTMTIPALPKTFLTGDTQFCPNQLRDFYKQAATILHDCETTPFRSNVHAHYDDLATLDPEIKERMWLYHYNSVPEVFEGHGKAQNNGFAGFVEVGQTFEI